MKKIEKNVKNICNRIRRTFPLSLSIYWTSQSRFEMIN